MYLPSHLFIYLRIYISSHLSIHLFMYLRIYIPSHLSTYLTVYESMYLPVCVRFLCVPSVHLLGAARLVYKYWHYCEL
jgi:hypothetical protein